MPGQGGYALHPAGRALTVKGRIVDASFLYLMDPALVPEFVREFPEIQLAHLPHS